MFQITLNAMLYFISCLNDDLINSIPLPTSHFFCLKLTFPIDDDKNGLSDI